MVKVRQDAWSHEDDLLLAETVLRHIREGSTQLNAFEEVGDHLNRTSAACGFRWNAEVRNKYNHAIDLAKRQRKEKKRRIASQVTQIKQPVISSVQEDDMDTVFHYEEQHEKESSIDMDLDSIINYLKEMKKSYYASNQSKLELTSVQHENEMLKQRVGELEVTLKNTEKQLATIQEDYQVFIQIMDRARRMTVLDGDNTLQSPAFRMDKNGNLQQLAQGSNQ